MNFHEILIKTLSVFTSLSGKKTFAIQSRKLRLLRIDIHTRLIQLFNVDAIANNIDGNFPSPDDLLIITFFLPQLMTRGSFSFASSLSPSIAQLAVFPMKITRKSLVQTVSNIYTADRTESIQCLSGWCRREWGDFRVEKETLQMHFPVLPRKLPLIKQFLVADSS